MTPLEIARVTSTRAMMTTTTTTTATNAVTNAVTTPARRASSRASRARRPRVVARARGADAREDAATVVAAPRASATRRGVAIGLATSAMALMRASAARAEVAPEFVDETREIIDSCRSILRGETLDDAFLDSFQDKRRAWFAKYQYHHGKSFYGYANTWNVQAKIGVQIAVNRENGEAYDADHTVYNRDYLLKILDKAEAELLDMQERNAF